MSSWQILANHLTQLATEKQVVTTKAEYVLCSLPRNTARLAPCNHEEAGTRIVLHLADAVNEGGQWTQMWSAFGTGPHFRYIPAHEIAKTLGPDKSCALPMFHAYTGCDTVSSFATKGKKTAWDTWKAFGDVTPTFLTLSTGPAQIADEDMALLELFTILLYDRTSNVLNIDEARL